MLTPQFVLPIAAELVIDLFAGGGGASTGIEQAIGRHVDIAINHDPEAVALHQANHPQTLHYVSDVFEVDPVAVCDGRPVGMLWASPDCKHFSKAKGGKPVSKKIRGLAWVVVKWAKLVRPRVIFLENVEEFQTWGPLGPDDRPCPQRKGRTFQRWKRSLENLGYSVDFREDRACDFGAPTIRKRLFLVARCDGEPIVFPAATHAAPGSLQVKAKKLKPWRTAAECIDWAIPCPSIFTRERPLAEATLRRIAKGVMRYVVDAAEPFIVNTRNGERAGQQPRVRSVRDPYWTVTGLGSQGAVVDATLVPTLIDAAHGEVSPSGVKRWGKGFKDIQAPMATVTASGGNTALVSAFLAKHYGGVVGSELPKPIGTVTTHDHHSLVAASICKLRGTSQDGQPVDQPLHTISAQGMHHAAVCAFLIKYYGTDQDPQLLEPLHTVTTKDRFGLVTVAGESYAIVDIGMRMLAPRELFLAQGFPRSYQIERGGDGRVLTKTAQVRMCGNSVSPPMAAAYVRSNYREQQPARMVA